MFVLSFVVYFVHSVAKNNIASFLSLSQAFYRLCLDPPGGGVWRGFNFSDDLTEPCSTLYCSGERSFDHTSNLSAVCTSRMEECFLPYSFICKLPLEVLWYLIYWLFFLLSWYANNVVKE